MIVVLPRRIVRQMRLARTKALPFETGGFVIGLRRGPHIEIVEATPQGPNDVATRTSFERRCGSHEKQIHARWRRSDGTETLVGDWHAHPVRGTGASSVDGSAWRALVKAVRLPVLGIIDVGWDRPHVFLKADRITPERELILIEDDGVDLAFAPGDRTQGPGAAARVPLRVDDP